MAVAYVMEIVDVPDQCRIGSSDTDGESRKQNEDYDHRRSHRVYADLTFPSLTLAEGAEALTQSLID